ncbi:hypothetical protein [Litoribacter ruber]|uniref:hypothetical protein n=1 Tax=Litoribacter ruber TaxID=702568 RepID=UPI001FE31976|nr:hypothetical protein [Litoribacter alkaliphilus]
MSTPTKPDPNRPYWREEIDKEFSRVKARMHAEAVQRGGGVALYTDCYTGKMLRGGDPYDYEHIRSSEEIFMQYRDRLTNEQIAKLVNCPENVAVSAASTSPKASAGWKTGWPCRGMWKGMGWM